MAGYRVAMPKRKRQRRRRPERLALYEGATYRELQQRLAKSVLRIRAERELSQEDAAHLCEMSTRLYQRAEGEEANLTLSTLARISDGLDVDIVELFRSRTRR